MEAAVMPEVLLMENVMEPNETLVGQSSLNTGLT
jgi:hypothetical protein